MKLKKSFWAKILISVIFLFSTSCSSIPVPNQKELKTENIYIEYMNIGDIYFSLEKYADAASNYKIAMQSKQLYWGVYYKLAKCYVYQNDWNQALIMYKKILKRDPENSTIKANIAYIYLMQGNFAKAEAIYEFLLSEQPDNKSYLENYLAMFLANETKFTSNIDKFNTSFEFYKEKYPDDENITKFQKKVDELNDKNKKSSSKSEIKEETEFTDEELYGLDTENPEEKTISK